MRIEPEHVLEQDRLTTTEVRGVRDQIVRKEEARVKEVVHEQHRQTSSKNRSSECDDDGCDEECPNREGHIKQLHTLGTLVQHCRNVVHSTHDG